MRRPPDRQLGEWETGCSFLIRALVRTMAYNELPMTHAVRIHETGGPEVLRFEPLDLRPPGPGEALIQQRAIGVNFIDTYHRSGLYPLPRLPATLGVEAAGIVEAVGPGVSDLAAGDRVAYASGAPGAYAERRVVPANRLVRLPDGVSEEVASAILLKGMTVEYLVRRCYPVSKGQTVLWHAAAGGVGLIACQWLAALGVTVIGTVGSPDKATLARDNGCRHTILYTEEDFVQRVRELTGGKGVPVVYDSVGKSTFEASLDCLSPRGMLVGFGNASGKPDPFDMGILAQKGSLYLTRPTLFAYTATRHELTECAAALFQMLERGAVRPRIAQKWPLSAAADAHRALESRATVGSSLLLP
jgi:NADPH:quinone reductase